LAPNPVTEQATTALRLAREDPRRAEALGREAYDLAVATGDPEAESTALRALGLAASTRHSIPEAVEYLRRAVSAADTANDTNLAAETRLSLAGALVLAGRSLEAIATLDEARGTGRTALVVASQRAAVLAMLGRYDEALQGYRRVVSGFHRMGDQEREARALNNRGLLHVYGGRFAQAEADMARAQRLMEDAGRPIEAATYEQNRGYAAARKGDLPTALALFEQADRRCEAVGVQPGIRGLHRAGALLAAGLFGDARRAAEDALVRLRSGGDRSSLAEGLMILADIDLLTGDAGASRAAAEEAQALFDQQERAGWRSLAQAAIARAALAQGDRGAAIASSASEAARHLEAMGLSDQATMAHAVAGRLWLKVGEAETGTAELERAGLRRHRGTAPGRLAAWEALAESRLAQGNRRGAMAAARRALAVVEDQQTSLSATELRAHVAVHAGAAARLDLRMAIATGRAAAIWLSMERYRANGLRTAPARPPRDKVLAGLLAELRGVAEEVALLAGDGRDPSRLLVRQGELERRVRERAWQATGGSQVRPREGGLPRPGELVTALGEAALVELGELGGNLFAVTVVDGRWRYRNLAAVVDAHRELAHLRLALRRSAYGEAHRALEAGAAAQLALAAAGLDRLLLAPIASEVGDRPVVLVPTGELHAVPWAALPSLAGRTIVVSPSSHLWLRSVRARHTQRGRHSRVPAVVVAGRGLLGADEEAAAIAVLHPGARALSGRSATVEAVTAALEGAGLAHIAAHSRVRADNGLWSSLELADGPLTVYELEQLRELPSTIVLSACDSGLSSTSSGDEVMGLVAALLSLGARSVVASVVPVQDKASRDFMVALHRALIAGGSPAAALAGAQASSTGTVGLAYVCFGGN
jgi:Tfp pilus assembly protein PilF